MNDIVNAITIPALDSAEYASGLNSAFENINRNFMTLGNSGFLKGQMGDSVRVIEKPLYENGEYTELGTKLLNAIIANATETELGSVTIGNTTLSWDDNIKLKPSIQVICNDATDGTDIVVSSLYYMVFDGRYANTELGFADEEEYLGKKDISCIVMYNGVEDKFEVMTDSFPTLYYEDGVGLCWRINGSNTGLPVRGLTGKDGQNATFDVIKCGIPIKDGETVYSEVTHIFEQFYGYRPLEEYNAADVEFRLNGQSVIILAPTIEEEDSGNSFYFGKVGKKDDKLYGYFGTGTSVSTAINIEEIVNLLKNISITASSEDISSKIKGLFIPMDKEQEDGTQAVHLMSATGIVNEVGNTSSRKTDFIFTPIDDINKLDITPEKPLEVGKFLYLEIDPTATNIFEYNNTLVNDYPLFDEQTFDSPIVLKYKLDSIITTPYIYDGSIDPRLDSFTNQDILENTVSGDPSRYLGKIKYDGEISAAIATKYLTENDVIYVNDNQFTFNHLDSMPTEYKERLGLEENQGRGIYRWVLCDVVHKGFDADWLLNFATYTFDDRFRAVFTTSVTPGLSDSIMWFNGMSLYKDSIMQDGSEVDVYVDNENQSFRYPVIGWTTDTPFKFHKFVPVYFNKHIEDVDTALNLNYNVNITGISDTDDLNPKNSKRNLNVHGDINCENINVYRLTATDEIANIYTKDVIVSDGGIDLRKVDDSGNVVNHTFIDGGTVNTQSVVSDSIIVNNGLTANAVNVSNTDFSISTNDGKHTSFSISKSVPATTTNNSTTYKQHLQNIKDTNIDVDINNVRNLTIKCGDFYDKEHGNTENDTTNGPKLISEIPTIIKDSGPVVIANNKVPETLLYKGSEIYYKMQNKYPSYDDTKRQVLYDISCSNPSAENVVPKTYTPSILTKSFTHAENTTASSPYIAYSNINDNRSAVDGKCACVDAAYGTISSGDWKDKYVAKYTIPKSGTAVRNDKIEISFNKNLICAVGGWIERRNKKWPKLHSDSYVRFDVIAQIDSTYIKLKPKTEVAYNFPTSGDWKGYENPSNLDWMFRSYSYLIKPSDITIEITSSNENKALYDETKQITLYVVPSVYIKMTSEKKNIDDIYCTLFRPYGTTNYSSLTQMTSIAPSTVNKSISYSNVATLKFTSKSYGASNSASSTLTGKGITFQTGSHAYGFVCADLYDVVANQYRETTYLYQYTGMSCRAEGHDYLKHSTAAIPVDKLFISYLKNNVTKSQLTSWGSEWKDKV